MGKDGPYILEGDDEADIITEILEICGFEFSEDPYVYLDNDGPDLLPTKEMLEKQLEPNSRLMRHLDTCEVGYLEYLILGAFILQTGIKLPEALKEKILKTADWKTEEWRWKDASESFKEERKKVLKDFQEKIRSHRPGIITTVL